MRAATVYQMVGGVAGAAGVALSAIAAHAGGGNVGTAATMLLAHAPVFLAVGLSNAGRAAQLAAAVLLSGVALFCGDLLVRELGAARLFPMAAPAGGILMMAGWLGLALAALRTPRG